VAGFCSKCGAPLAPGTQFCPACGTPVAAAPAAAPAPGPAFSSTAGGPVAAPFMPVAPQPVAPPQQGSSAVKIVLIVVAVIVGLGILAAGAFGFFVWRVAHSIHVSGNRSEVSINTPGGRIHANSTENFTASDLGVDPYPGAEPTKGGMRMSLPSGSMISAAYLTSDSSDQVLNFYKSRLSGNVSTFNTVNGAVITWNKDRDESVVVTITSNASEFDGKTQIHIVHTKKS